MSNGLHEIKKQWDTNKSYYDQRTFCPRGLEFYLWIQITTLGFFYILQYSLLLFRYPLFMRAFPHYIGFSWSSGPYTCWSPGTSLEHSSHQTSLSALCELRQPRQYCSGVFSILMRSEKQLVHLMWWWQFFLRYFEFSSLLCVQGVYFNCLNIHLVWVSRVRGEVPPWTFFSLSPADEACNVDHLSYVSSLGLVSVLRQAQALIHYFGP